MARVSKTDSLMFQDGTFANHMFYILAVYFAQNTKPPLLPKFVKDYDDLMWVLMKILLAIPICQ